MDSRIVKVVVKGNSMWPSLKDGDVVEFQEFSKNIVTVGDIVVFQHPLKSEVTCLKRVTSIDNERLFVEGDNPDPLGSEDSHNFGPIKTASIIAIKGGPGGI